MKITTDLIMDLKPCYQWPRARVERAVDAAGGDLVTLLRSIPPEDALWMVLREDFIPAPALHELACKYAEDALAAFEAAHPNDKRPRDAIEISRSWARGDITDKQLEEARKIFRMSRCAIEDRATTWEAMRVQSKAYMASGATMTGNARNAALYTCNSESKRHLELAIEQMEAAQNGKE
jgi:hypothetical protein